LAQRAQERGYANYREVRLKETISDLKLAIQIFKELGQEIIKPREVARALLTLGQAQLEQGEPLDAARSFQEALWIDPSLRLRPGYDHPEAVKSLEEARFYLIQQSQLRGNTRPLPQRPPKEHFLLIARLHPDRLEIAIHSRRGLSFEQQSLELPPREGASRLASRIRACLPFGHRPKRQRRRHLYVDVGLESSLFLKAPVESFYSVGLGLSLEWLFAEHLSLALSGGISNSNRDYSEDLREDLLSLHLFLGPGYHGRWGRLSYSGHLGAELGFFDELIQTTNPACKFFSVEDQPPLGLCDHQRDVQRTPQNFSLGPALSLGLKLKLVGPTFMALSLRGSSFVYERYESGLGYPVGGYLGLGARAF